MKSIFTHLLVLHFILFSTNFGLAQKLITFPDIPGRTASDKYQCRVRQVGTEEWESVFVIQTKCKNNPDENDPPSKGALANSAGTVGGGGSAGAKSKGGDAITGVNSFGIAGAEGGADGGKGINSNNIGNPGNLPGAGGSGAAVRASSNSTMKGGDGSNGKIIFSFRLATNLTTTLSGSNKTIDIYPNPATDKLFISSINKTIIKIQLIDLSGKIVYNNNEVIQNEIIDLWRFISGLYFVQIHTNDNIFTEKVKIK